MTTAPTSYRTAAVCHRSTGAGCPQCPPRAKPTSLAGPRGRAPTMLAAANCDGCAYLRTLHTRGEPASQSVDRRLEWAAGLVKAGATRSREA